MTVQEIIKALENVAPDTVVEVATNGGVFPVEDVRTLGYSGGRAVIVVGD